jgi:hypothetical protein
MVLASPDSSGAQTPSSFAIAVWRCVPRRKQTIFRRIEQFGEWRKALTDDDPERNTEDQ